jgi:SPW repeat
MMSAWQEENALGQPGDGMAFALTGSKRPWFRTSRFKEVSALKYVMRSNLVLGLWLMISPFVLGLLNQRVFGVLWEDFLLGFAIATFSLWRLWSRTGAAFADFMMMALGLTTLLNPILYHYFNIEGAAWNNLAVGSAVFVLAIYQDRKDSASPGGGRQ